MLADTTYQVYCSNLRKYRKNVKETEGKADHGYWVKQQTRMEARILAGGRQLPVEKEEPELVIPNNVEVRQENPQTPLSKEVTMYLNAYKRAMLLNDPRSAEKFKEVLKNLGVEVKDEPEPASGNGNGNAV